MDKLLVGGVSLQLVKCGTARRDGKGLVYLYKRDRHLQVLRSGFQVAATRRIKSARASSNYVSGPVVVSTVVRRLLSAAVHKDGDAVPAAMIVKFVLQRRCWFGQAFNIVGDDPLLGAWNPDSAIPMVWSDGHIWACEVELPAGKQYEFKFILKDGNQLEWQPGPNRCFSTETSGGNSLTVVDGWDEDASPLLAKTAAGRENAATLETHFVEQTTIFNGVKEITQPVEEEHGTEDPARAVPDPAQETEPPAIVPDDPPKAANLKEEPAKAVRNPNQETDPPERPPAAFPDGPPKAAKSREEPATVVRNPLQKTDRQERPPPVVPDDPANSTEEPGRAVRNPIQETDPPEGPPPVVPDDLPKAANSTEEPARAVRNPVQETDPPEGPRPPAVVPGDPPKAATSTEDPARVVRNQVQQTDPSEGPPVAPDDLPQAANSTEEPAIVVRYPVQETDPPEGPPVVVPPKAAPVQETDLPEGPPAVVPDDYADLPKAASSMAEPATALSAATRLPAKAAVEHAPLGTEENVAVVEDVDSEQTSTLHAAEELYKPNEEEPRSEEREIVPESADSPEAKTAVNTEEPAYNIEADLCTAEDCIRAQSTTFLAEDRLEQDSARGNTITGEKSQVLPNEDQESSLSEAPENDKALTGKEDRKEESDPCLVEDSRGYITFRF